MRIHEFITPLNTYIGSVRIAGTSIKTCINAECVAQARLLLIHLYGSSNVGSISQIQLDEQTFIDPIPTQINQDRVVNGLTYALTQIQNQPIVTQQTLRKAINRYLTNQKRENLKVQKQQDLENKRHKHRTKRTPYHQDKVSTISTSKSVDT